MGQGTAAIQHNNMVYDHTQLRWVGNEDEVSTDHWDDMSLDELEPDKGSNGTGTLQHDDSLFLIDSRYMAKLRDSVSSMNERYTRQAPRVAAAGQRDPALLIREYAVDALVAMARRSHTQQYSSAAVSNRNTVPLPFPHLTSPRGVGSSSSSSIAAGISPRAGLPVAKRSNVRDEFKETEEDADFMDIDLDESKVKSAPLVAVDGPKPAPNLKGLLGSVTIDDDLEI